MASSICYYCNKPFASRFSLRRHYQTIHNNELELLNRTNTITCKEPNCNFSCNFVLKLCRHLSDVHNFNMEIEEKNFDSEEEFKAWKEDFELKTKSSYYVRTSKKTDLTLIEYLYCHRSGNFVSTSKGKRQLKSQGSCKIEHICTSHIVVKKTKDNVNIRYCKTHYGHDLEISHIRLTNSQKLEIAEKIKVGLPFDVILDDIRSKVTNSLERINLITKTDLHNIASTFNLRKNIDQKHSDDAISVATWIEDMEKLDKSNPIRFFKSNGTKDDEYNTNDDFILILMTNEQKRMLKDHGEKIICIDTIQGVNTYKFGLTTIMIINNKNEGLPVAFLVSTRHDIDIMKLFFEVIKREIGILKVDIFMSTDDETFVSAWIDVMGDINKGLLCTWYVDNSWRKNLSKIKNKENRCEIYKLIRTLLEESDVNKFYSLLSVAIESMKANPDTIDFAGYFEKNYANRAEMWAYCHRSSEILNSNIFLESFHKILKHIYLKGRKIKRLDSTLNALMRLVRDKNSDASNIIFLKDPYKIREIRRCHNRCIELNADIKKLNEFSWQIICKDSLYTIERVSTKLLCDCSLRCEDCNICIHMYKCTCPDSVIKGNICKHIHYLIRNILYISEETYYEDFNVSNELMMHESVYDSCYEDINLSTQESTTFCQEVENLEDIKNDIRHLAAAVLTNISEIESKEILNNVRKNLKNTLAVTSLVKQNLDKSDNKYDNLIVWITPDPEGDR